MHIETKRKTLRSLWLIVTASVLGISSGTANFDSSIPTAYDYPEFRIPDPLYRKDEVNQQHSFHICIPAPEDESLLRTIVRKGHRERDCIEEIHI